MRAAITRTTLFHLFVVLRQQSACNQTVDAGVDRVLPRSPRAATTCSLFCIIFLWKILISGTAVAGGLSYESQTDRVLDLAYPDFREKLEKQIAEKKSEGYFVRNPSLPRKAWHNTLGRLPEWWQDRKGGQCQELEQWGREWLENIVPPGTIIDHVTMYRNYFINHVANRIILPNGHELIIDYWEMLITGKVKIYSLDEWAAKWRRELGGSPILNDKRAHQGALENAIHRLGEEKGIENYRERAKRQSEERALEAETMINWWNNQKPYSGVPPTGGHMSFPGIGSLDIPLGPASTPASGRQDSEPVSVQPLR